MHLSYAIMKVTQETILTWPCRHEILKMCSQTCPSHVQRQGRDVLVPWGHFLDIGLVRANAARKYIY